MLNANASGGYVFRFEDHSSADYKTISLPNANDGMSNVVASMHDCSSPLSTHPRTCLVIDETFTNAGVTTLKGEIQLRYLNIDGTTGDLLQPYSADVDPQGNVNQIHKRYFIPEGTEIQVSVVNIHPSKTFQIMYGSNVSISGASNPQSFVMPGNTVSVIGAVYV